MKKIMSRAILCCLFLLMILASFENVNAVTLNLNYNNTKESQQEKGHKIYPGDEFFVSFALEGTNANNVMAIYGKIEYDDAVLDLIQENNFEGLSGDGWQAQNTNTVDNTFFIYALDKNRSNNVAYLKFRVKEDATDIKNTSVSISDISYYEQQDGNNYKEISSEDEKNSVEIKINNKSTDSTFIVIYIILFAIAIIIIFYIVIKKCKACKKDNEEATKTSENKMSTQDKMREVLRKAKEEAEAKNKEDSETKSTKNEVKDENETDENGPKSENKPESKNNKKKNEKDLNKDSSALENEKENKEKNKTSEKQETAKVNKKSESKSKTESKKTENKTKTASKKTTNKKSTNKSSKKK